MRAFAIHDSAGNIRALVTAPPDAPPPGPPAESSELLSEVELQDYPSDAGDQERHESLMRVAQDFRVQFEQRAKLVPKSDSPS
jgi:hypothetical protein